jgi:hypothetical protein
VSTNHGATFVNIPGATLTTLSFTTSVGENSDEYRAVFTNSAGHPNTSAATLTVTAVPAVTLNPLSQTITAGHMVTFSAAASGSPAPTVQWQVSTNNGASFVNIPGATSPTLSFTTTAGENGYLYRAVFTNSTGHVNTSNARLTVVAALSPAKLATDNAVSEFDLSDLYV